MKAKNINIICGLSLILASCSVETPFQGPSQQGEGYFSKSALGVELEVDETIKSTRAALSNLNVDDFDVKFINTSSNQPVKQFMLRDLPDIVTLSAGNYRIEVTYNEDQEAAWNNPHFKGVSRNFDVRANEITSDLETISCSLKNVMVSVVLDSELLKHIEGEPEIEVWVNQGQPLTFKKEHYDSSNPIPGFFKQDGVCTLTAQFSGNVDGAQISEIKTLDNVEAGNHYRLTFYRHSYQGEDQGNIEGDIKVDAKVDVNKVSTNVPEDEDKPLDDVTWPTEEPEEGPDPGQTPTPNPPTPDDPETEGPSVDVGESTVEFGENIVTPDTKVILDIHSDGVNGIEKFKIIIESTDETLADMKEIDLVDPNPEMLDDLHGFLGLLPEDKDTLAGETDVHFDISKFMSMLCMLGEGTHKFIIQLGDSTGENEIEFLFIVDQDWN